MRRRTLLAPARHAFAWAAFLAASSGVASPWILPRGTIVVTGTYNYQLARREFIDGGPSRDFPLNGRYTGTSFQLGVRTSLVDGLEFEMSLPLRFVNYASDPVVLLDRPAGSNEGEIDYYQRNVLNLSRTASGVGDLNLAARWRLVQRPFALALEARLKAPTGYAQPQGTFGERPQTSAEFLADVRRYVAPENVRDDVTLGDGQLDASLGLLFGYAFPTRTFVRADAAYNARFGGAGHQVLGALRAGQSLFGDRMLVYAWMQLAYSVTEGRVLGVSVSAVDPSLPATEYLGARNLLLRELRLERDLLDAGGGVIVRITPDVELNLGYSRTLWGRNTAVVDSLSLSVGVRTQLPMR